MVDLSDRGEAIDATTVRTILDSQGDLKILVAYPILLKLLILYQLQLMRSIMLKNSCEKAILRQRFQS